MVRGVPSPLPVDGPYSKNKPSTLPTFILKTKHQDRFRGFKLTNSRSLVNIFIKVDLCKKKNKPKHAI
jgi:hypothetical protein